LRPVSAIVRRHETPAMPHGRSLRIFLADGSVGGVRHAEIVNWTGQAISCPRTDVSSLANWPEASRPGVYFLFGVDEDSGREAAYIGEAENVLARLSSHVADKEFWNEVVLFTNKDENLTKAHVKYLEARLIALALSAKRYRLENANSPQNPVLPRADLAAMEEFLDSARILLGMLGHRLLEPLARRQSPQPSSPIAPPPQQTPTVTKTPSLEVPEGTVFALRTAGLDAYAVRTDEGLVVLAGSEAAKESQGSLSGGYRRKRDQLETSGVLVEDGGKLRFTADQLLASPSQAAAIIVGYAINGRDAWKTEDGISINEIERQTAHMTSNISVEPDAP